MPFKVAAVHKPSCYITFLHSFSPPFKKTTTKKLGCVLLYRLFVWLYLLVLDSRYHGWIHTVKCEPWHITPTCWCCPSPNQPMYAFVPYPRLSCVMWGSQGPNIASLTDIPWGHEGDFLRFQSKRSADCCRRITSAPPLHTSLIRLIVDTRSPCGSSQASSVPVHSLIARVFNAAFPALSFGRTSWFRLRPSVPDHEVRPRTSWFSPSCGCVVFMCFSC